VRTRTQEQIDRTVDGQEISLEPEEEPRAQVIDLMEALKSSLAEKAGDRRPAKRAASAKTQKAAKNKKSSSG
jgi:non-homologous end joining protein Ku